MILMLHYRRAITTLFYRYDFDHYPAEVYWAARWYGYKSVLAIKSNQTKFFMDMGGYTIQWSYLWRLLGFWNKDEIVTKKINYHRGVLVKKNKLSSFLKKKQAFLTLSDNGDDWDILEENTYIHYFSKANKGFNITNFDHHLNRVFSIHPGKNGEYSGAARRSYVTTVSWWHYLFSTINKSAVIRNKRHYKYNKTTHYQQNLILKIFSINNTLVKYFFLINKYINGWHNKCIYIHIIQNFRKLNVVLKKKRYMKKFKRRSLLKADLYDRKSRIIRPLPNAT